MEEKNEESLKKRVHNLFQKRFSILHETFSFVALLLRLFTAAEGFK